MTAVGKPRWQQLTALVSLGAGGTIAGMSFVPGAHAEVTSAGKVPLRLVALERLSQPLQGPSAATKDAMLRSAIVNVAGYYLQMAKGKTPAEMEAIIWQQVSIGGADHGESCAAFASLTLELGAQVVGQQSWVTGGTTYPWPLHSWADVRVDPNPDSLSIVSILQDAEAHGRWHPLGDGYQPQPGDWVLFDQHVEVVTGYSNGVLDTIGGDSLPNYSVNAHQFSGPLAAQGVDGFVDNGSLTSAPGTSAPGGAGNSGTGAPNGAGQAGAPGGSASQQAQPSASVPGLPSGGQPSTPAPASSAAPSIPGVPPGADAPAGPAPGAPAAAIPGTGGASSPGAAGKPSPAAGQSGPPAPAGAAGNKGSAAIPGLATVPQSAPGTIPGVSGAQQPSPSQAPGSSQPPASAPADETSAQRAFIDEVAPGAMDTQRQYGIPAAVTIAQAILESGWGQSQLATADHNLFGMKGRGPAGSDALPTQEYVNGQWVTTISLFRVYDNYAQSIADHGKLLATSGLYKRAMAAGLNADAFANDLTGVYATDPDYGAKLISLMNSYDLYQYDTAAAAAAPAAPAPKPQPGPAKPTPTPTSRAQPAPTSSPAAAARQVPAARTPLTATLAAAFRPSVAGAAFRPALQPAATGAAPRAPKRPAPARAAAPYIAQIPMQVKNAFVALAKVPLASAEPLYRDVASVVGIAWQLLAACDWMECEARRDHSPVYGEKLGTPNPDGTVYRTKSEALEQCARDLAGLARAVYGIDLSAPGSLSVRDLASAFAAFRWGGLLKLHRTSAMEFPYSVAGLTSRHLAMHWPAIDEPNAPDKPGARFRMRFGAVPAVLCLRYPATAA